MKSVSYIEIDIPVCSLTYGVAPCAASIPESGAIKCFNSVKTCQDRENYSETIKTLRFAVSTEYLPRDIDAMPFVKEISFSPATISLGENLGTRASLNVIFVDAPHSDTGDAFDKYLADRDYDPFKRGTFWGKFRARQPFLRGRDLRWINGRLGQSLAEMETRHFIIDSFDGASADGTYTLVAKDVLKLADGDRSQAPLMSGGFLGGAITNTATSVTLQPLGIGDAEYPASGLAAIGGREIVSFTRSGDTLTLAARALLGTTAQSHNAQDRVQMVLEHTAVDPADIIFNLMVGYAGVPANLIDLASWKAETATFLGRLYTGYVCEPTPVATLISELILQACLCIWWDDVTQKIKLQVLRSITANATRLTPENVLQGSFTVKEQPDKRLSQVQVYFGQINPLKQLSDTENYRSTSVTVDDQAVEDYGGSVIKTIYSRWIPALGRTVADRLGAIQLSRFRDPPRKFTFDAARYAQTDVSLGGGYNVAWHCLQDATGAPVDVPVQITRLNPPADRFKCEAEEVLYNPPADDASTHFIIIDTNQANINLRSAHDLLYAPPTSGITVICRVVPTAFVYSESPLFPAFDVGTWPAGVTLKLIIEGNIRGAGGKGGVGYSPFAGGPANGQAGGTALFTRQAIEIEFPPGATLWGGGGGGGGGSSDGNIMTGFGGGGGGGAGMIVGPGSGGTFPGNNGAEVAGGAPAPGGPTGGSGGDGGGAGLAGRSGVAVATSGGAGGAAGRSIDGLSFITFTIGGGDPRGPQVN